MTAIVTKINLTIGELIQSVITPLALPIIEMNVVPDVLIRLGMRREMEAGLLKFTVLTVEERQSRLSAFVRELKTLPIAINQSEANEQHYEVPDQFYQLVLGPCLKYSSGYWPTATTTFRESEIAMLELYCERAQLQDGMNIIDLGCGWGSVTLFLAKKYPNSKIVSISNSNSQRAFITGAAAQRGLTNVQVFTGDINAFDLPKEEFYDWADRVISIEMFEHMKNYYLLMQKVSNWIKPMGGKLFVHIFSYQGGVPTHYEKGWMSDTFFTGGQLPSDNLLLHFQEHLQIEDHWIVSGTHYQRTCEAWLRNLDDKKAQVMPLLAQTYGEVHALKWFVNWRLFFIACAEFFGMKSGQEYVVSHYLFTKKN